MKKLRKNLAILMATTIFTVCVTGVSSGETVIDENVSVKANSSGIAVSSGMPNGDREMTPQEYADYMASFSNEDLQRIAEKTAEAERLANQPRPRASSMTQLSGFSVYRQSTDTYCVPATARTIVQYVLGTSDSQATIASDMGYPNGMVPRANLSTYLQTKILNYWYIYTAHTNQSAMTTRIRYAVVSFGKPAAMSVTATTTANWGYTTNGHTLAVHGIQTDDSIIRFADPWGGFGGNAHPSFFNRESSSVANVSNGVTW